MAQVISKISHAPDEMIFYIFASALFIPEIALIVSKNFRHWLKNAVENSDGIFDKSELKDVIAYIGSFYCAKLFAFLVLCNIFYVIEVKEVYIYLTFAGFTGTTGIIQASKIFKKG